MPRPRRIAHQSSVPQTADPKTLATLFAVAILAAAFDAIAGGGGLVTLPALLLAGLDPVAALATNKLQSSGGSLSATCLFARRGLIAWRVAWTFAVAAALASIGGALSVALLPRDGLSAAVPIVLVAVAGYFLLAPSPNEAESIAHNRLLAVAWCTGIGFYDGIFGPGAGSFYMIGFVALMGCGIVRATAQTKLANAASNVGALTLFAVSGKVVWPIGLVMAAGAVLGGQIGSRLALRHGARFIRPLVVTICCALALRLLADPANPLRHAIAGLVAHVGS